MLGHLVIDTRGSMTQAVPPRSLALHSYQNVPIKVGATAFILPCHNEAADLEAALESIKNQVGVSVDTILVVSDNSTDDTVVIARAAGVVVIETTGNRFKKAGALNTGIRFLMESGSLPEFIITGDGDTEYDPHFVAHSLNVMRSNPRLGVLSAVCFGKTGLVSFPRWSHVSSTPRHAFAQRCTAVSAFSGLFTFFAVFWQWMTNFLNFALVWMQQAEYTRAAALRIRKNIHTMSGAGSMLRVQAVVDVLRSQLQPDDPIVWQDITLYREHESNLVEDFALTLDVKRAGWQCTNNFYVIARTDLMRDFSSLIRQRIRWVRGTIDELRRRKYSRGSRASTATLVFGFTMIPLTYVLNGYILKLAFSGNFTLMDLWMFPLMGAYQAIMVRKMGWWSMFVAFILLPEMLYAVMRHSWIIISLGKSFSSTTQQWE